MATTSFIWPTASMRSLTACVCSARERSSTPLMRSMWPCAQSRYGSRTSLARNASRMTAPAAMTVSSLTT